MVSASEAISTSAWPTPTVSTSTTSQPAASSTRSACGTAADSPPRWPREAIERMNTPVVGGVILHAHPVAEQRAAGERRGRVDGEHADALARRARSALDQRRRRRRLADAGRAGQADDLRVPGERRPAPPRPRAAAASRSRPARSAGRPRAGQPPRARSTRSRDVDVAPSRAAARSGGAGTCRISASPWPPPPHSAAAPVPPPRRLSSSASVSASRAPDMPIGWPSAIAPPLTLTMSSVDAEVLHRLDADRRERLVDLDQVEVADGRGPPCAARP